jgi:putative ABC transport system permease protein
MAPVLGSIVYYQLVSLGLALGLKPADLKLVTGLFVLATLALPALRRGTEPDAMRE